MNSKNYIKTMRSSILNEINLNDEKNTNYVKNVELWKILKKAIKEYEPETNIGMNTTAKNFLKKAATIEKINSNKELSPTEISLLYNNEDEMKKFPNANKEDFKNQIKYLLTLLILKRVFNATFLTDNYCITKNRDESLADAYEGIRELSGNKNLDTASNMQISIDVNEFSKIFKQYGDDSDTFLNKLNSFVESKMKEGIVDDASKEEPEEGEKPTDNNEDGEKEKEESNNSSKEPDKEETNKEETIQSGYSSRSWGITRPTKKNKEIYIDTLKKYRDKFDEKLKEILEVINTRKNEETEKRNKENERLNKEFSSVVMKEALIKAGKTINEAFIKDKALERASARDNNLYSELDKKYKELFNKIEGQFEKKINGSFSKLHGMSYNKSDFSLTTIFTDYETALNKLLVKAKKEARGTFIQRREEAKEGQRRYIDSLKANDPKHQADEAFKQEKRNAETENKFEKLSWALENPRNDIQKLFKLSFLNYMNSSKNLAEISNVLRIPVNFYATNESNNGVMSGSFVTYKNIASLLDGCNIGFSWKAIKDDEELASLRAKLKEKNMFANASENFAYYNECIKSFTNLVNAAPNTDGTFEYKLPTTSKGKYEISGVDIEDVALRQAIAGALHAKFFGGEFKQNGDLLEYVNKNIQRISQKQLPKVKEDKYKDSEINKNARDAGVNFSVDTNATVTTASADGLPIGYQNKLKKAMKRKII